MAAFINIDLAAVGSWAERNGIAYTSYSDLASRTEVYDLIRGCLEQVNRDLPSDSSMAASQVRRFLILPKRLAADEGHLTSTRKVSTSTTAALPGSLMDEFYRAL